MNPAEVARLAPGATLLVRRAGSAAWVEARLKIASTNGEAIMVAAPEGLGGGGRGFALDASTGEMALALLWTNTGAAIGRWVDINTGLTWSLR